MATLIAKIDSLDPRWFEEFYEVLCNGTQNEIHDWLLENAACPREETDMDEVYDDVILQDPEWVITYRDLMCETCYLYELRARERNYSVDGLQLWWVQLS